MTQSPSRHTDTGSHTWTYAHEQWVKCVRCGQAGTVKHRRFACRHCALVLQNADNRPYHWFGDCRIRADGRCYHCGTKYSIDEHHPKPAFVGRLRGFDITKTITCQSCHRKNVVTLLFYKKSKHHLDDEFGMPLLLALPFKGHVFWAYNDKHLAELKTFIGADLRERTHMAGNGSMISRLPLWIKSAKNRDELLKLIEKLEKISPHQLH
ncbi:MAG: hypothetical protein Q3971_08595 [Moraxella sp.]|nr:hypothetical protein [Moraxella sp.]